jgi:hypothetical protein
MFSAWSPRRLIARIALAIVATSGCSDDAVVVRTELLPFEPKTRLEVNPISLTEPHAVIEARVADGPIEAGRAFHCEFGVHQNPPGRGEMIVVEIMGYPPDKRSEPVLLWHTVKLREYSNSIHGAQVVKPLRLSGQWRGDILLQEGQSGKLGPPRKIGEFTFDVVDSK